MRSHHPANIKHHDQATFGQRMADKVAKGMGSWRFIGIQTIVIICWIILNVTAVINHWDNYPFILLNLLFSTQAAYAAPILQLANNRQSEHDRIQAEEDFDTNLKAYQEIVANTSLTKEVHDLLQAVRKHLGAADD